VVVTSLPFTPTHHSTSNADELFGGSLRASAGTLSNGIAQLLTNLGEYLRGNRHWRATSSFPVLLR
jgi:hypothetical protein